MERSIEFKNGYSFLREMCSFNADFSAFNPKINPLTNRVKYIIHQLEKMDIPYELDYFDTKNPNTVHIGRPKFVNVVVRFKATTNTNDTIVYLAHHDVANIDSENCQDNTASVCNLIDLCQRLKHKNTINKNVVIAFVDAEEIVQMDKCGSKRLAIRIQRGDFGNVLYAVNLELTANGNRVWASCDDYASPILKRIKEEDISIPKVGTPYNDAFILIDNDIDSVCVGTLTEKEMQTLLNKGFCGTWSLCHSYKDTFDKANETDMSNFVSFLEKLL